MEIVVHPANFRKIKALTRKYLYWRIRFNPFFNIYLHKGSGAFSLPDPQPFTYRDTFEIMFNITKEDL